MLFRSTIFPNIEGLEGVGYRRLYEKYKYKWQVPEISASAAYRYLEALDELRDGESLDDEA